MADVSPVFDQHYKDYIRKTAALDLTALAPLTGGRAVGDQQIEIAYFNRPYIVSEQGVSDASGRKPGYDTCIVLCRYLIMAEQKIAGHPPAGPAPETAGQDWASFRDLNDSGPLTVYFKDNVETAICDTLENKLPLSPDRFKDLAPDPAGMDLQYDLVLKVDALPKVPVLVLANAAEPGFAASCSVLFRPDVETWLDAECIAMAGVRLARIIHGRFSA